MLGQEIVKLTEHLFEIFYQFLEFFSFPGSIECATSLLVILASDSTLLSFAAHAEANNPMNSIFPDAVLTQ